MLADLLLDGSMLFRLVLKAHKHGQRLILMTLMSKEQLQQVLQRLRDGKWSLELRDEHRGRLRDVQQVLELHGHS